MVRRLPVLALTAMAVAAALLVGAYAAYALAAGYVAIPRPLNLVVSVGALALAGLATARLVERGLR